MKKTVISLISVLLITCLQAQKAAVKSGPMPGYVEFSEACIWVQTTTATPVKIRYWKQKDSVFETLSVTTEARNHYCAKLIMDQIGPGNTYTYEILLGGKPAKPQKTYTIKVPALWRYRTDPPTIRFATGSCHFTNQPEHDRPGTPYGDTLPGIFNSIVSKNPEFMLWLGDNIYLREPDWNSKTGIYKRYDHVRSNPELNNLLSYCPQYAIWDDHDFGPNNSDRSFWNKEMTLQAFKDYWANPSYGVNGQPGITTAFNYGDADFFLMDDRYYRSPEHTPEYECEVLGQNQLQWLKDNLLGSQAKFKFVAVGSQFLNSAPVGENMITCPRERQEIISFIYRNKIKNVIFLTGDRHHSEISVLKADSLPAIYDITVSPLSSGAGNWGLTEGNTLRVKGTILTGKRNFAIIEITGTSKERKLSLIYYGREGEELLKYEIAAE